QRFRPCRLFCRRLHAAVRIPVGQLQCCAAGGDNRSDYGPPSRVSESSEYTEMFFFVRSSCLRVFVVAFGFLRVLVSPRPRRYLTPPPTTARIMPSVLVKMYSSPASSIAT